MGWGFDAGMLRVLLLSSEFLVALTVGMGAQIGDADLAAVSRACPNLQRITLRFATVSGEGERHLLLAVMLLECSQCSQCMQLQRLWFLKRCQSHWLVYCRVGGSD